MRGRGGRENSPRLNLSPPCSTPDIVYGRFEWLVVQHRFLKSRLRNDQVDDSRRSGRRTLKWFDFSPHPRLGYPMIMLLLALHSKLVLQKSSKSTHLLMMAMVEVKALVREDSANLREIRAYIYSEC